MDGTNRQHGQVSGPSAQLPAQRLDGPRQRIPGDACPDPRLLPEPVGESHCLATDLVEGVPGFGHAVPLEQRTIDLPLADKDGCNPLLDGMLFNRCVELLGNALNSCYRRL